MNDQTARDLPATYGSRYTSLEPFEPFRLCDDVHDAAADAVCVVEARLARRGLQLGIGCADSLKTAIVTALEGAHVEEIIH